MPILRINNLLSRIRTQNPYLVEHFLPSYFKQSNHETYFSRKFNELSEYIYFYMGIVNSSGAMRKNPTRGSKVHVSSSEKKKMHIMMQKRFNKVKIY